MSTREKQLLTVLLLAGFFIVNLFLYSTYKNKIAQARSNLDRAKFDLQYAISIQENSAQQSDQMEWLAANEPEPAFAQNVRSQLLEFTVSQATALGLTIKSRTIDIPTDTSGTYYDKVQMLISVSGREQSLYNWLHQINDPTQFRTAEKIRLSPNTQDPALIDCAATITQWFPPTPTNP